MSRTQPHTTTSDSSDTLKVRSLVTLRFLASLAYVVIFSLAWYLGAESIPYSVVTAAVLVSVVSNELLRRSLVWKRDAQIQMGLAILLDIVLLTVLLYCSGGYANPFSMIFIVHVTIAAVYLDRIWTWTAFALSVFCFASLFFSFIPFPQLELGHHAHGSGLSLHLHGMLIAFVLIGALLSMFLTRLASEIAEQSKEIERLREQKYAEDKLVSLTTLTAGAAHELATPIGTLTLIAEDMARELATESRWREDVTLLQSETARCQSILQKMRGISGELAGEMPTTTSIKSLITAMKSAVPQSSRVQFQCELDESAEITTLKDTFVSTLASVIRNALQASSDAASVLVCLRRNGKYASVTVKDSGCGMNPQQLARVGEPFFTTKPPGEGLGLGLFLARLFVRQVGGTFEISSELHQGTQVTLNVPFRYSP